MEFMPRRVVWSPDGSMLVFTGFGSEMVVSGDGGAGFAKRWPDTVSACAWYPGMRVENEASCAFAMAVPRCPVQLIDGRDGHVRASYRCHYGGDRMASVTSVLASLYLALVLAFGLHDLCLVCLSTYVVNAALLFLNWRRWRRCGQTAVRKRE